MKRIFSRNGQALVEFALVLPLLLALLFGVIQFGLVFGSQILLNSAVKEGARFAIVGAHDTPIRNRVKSVAFNIPVLEIADADIKISPDYQSRITGKLNDGNVTIEATGYVNTFFPLPGITNDGKFKLYSSSTMHYESNFTAINLEPDILYVLTYDFFVYDHNVNQKRLAYELAVFDHTGNFVNGAKVKLVITHDGTGKVEFNEILTTGHGSWDDGWIEKDNINPSNKEGSFTAVVESIEKSDYTGFVGPPPITISW